MSFMKKIAAAGLAVMMTAGLAACNTGGDTNWIAKMGDQTVPAGVYLGLMFDQYYNQTAKLSVDGGELPKKPLNESVDGKKVSELISENARKDLDDYLATESKFAELGLALDPEKEMMAEQEIASYWGFLQDSYKQNGISEESYRMIEMNRYKKDALFTSVYGENGTEPVPADEIQKKFLQDYAKVMVIPLSLSTSEDAAAKAEADQKARDAIEKYYKMLEEGKDMEDVVFEARKETAADPSTVTQAEKGTSYTFVNRDQPTYEDEIMEQIFSAEVGKPFKAESEYSVYLFVRYDINGTPADVDKFKLSIAYSLRKDAFEAKIAEWAAQLSGVTINDAAVKRYTPDKLKVF